MPEIFDPTGKKIGEIREEKNLVGATHFDVIDTTGRKVADIRKVGETETIIAEKAVSAASSGFGCVGLVVIAIVLAFCLVWKGGEALFFGNWGATRFWGPTISEMRVQPSGRYTNDGKPIYRISVTVKDRNHLISIFDREWDKVDFGSYPEKSEGTITSGGDVYAYLPVQCKSKSTSDSVVVSIWVVDGDTTVAVKREEIDRPNC